MDEGCLRKADAEIRCKPVSVLPVLRGRQIQEFDEGGGGDVDVDVDQPVVAPADGDQGGRQSSSSGEEEGHDDDGGTQAASPSVVESEAAVSPAKVPSNHHWVGFFWLDTLLEV